VNSRHGGFYKELLSLYDHYTLTIVRCCYRLESEDYN
jgi:hypothetical protein